MLQHVWEGASAPSFQGKAIENHSADTAHRPDSRKASSTCGATATPQLLAEMQITTATSENCMAASPAAANTR